MNKYSKCILITAVIGFCASAWSYHTLTLLEPAGGEVWVTGEHTVRWALTGDVWFGYETLTIECTRDGGETWSIWTIAAPASPFLPVEYY